MPRRFGRHGEPEKAAFAGFCVKRLELGAERRGLDDVPVAGVGREDVAVGGEGEPERAVQEASFGDRDPTAAERGLPEEGVGHGRDPVALRVGHVEGSFVAESDPGWADHQRGFIGALGESVCDHLASEVTTGA